MREAISMQPACNPQAHRAVFKRDSIDQSHRPAREKLSGSSGEHPGAGGFVKTLMIRNQLLEPLHLGSYLQSGAIRFTQVHSGALRCTQLHQLRTSAPWQRASNCGGTGTRSVAMQLGEI